MRNRELVPYRRRTLSDAAGLVLEVGIGSGLNLPFYGPQAREILGLEPSAGLLAMARRPGRWADPAGFSIRHPDTGYAPRAPQPHDVHVRRARKP